MSIASKLLPHLHHHFPMVLEVAAAIIGILAAAGKVAEILAPFALAWKDLSKNATAILSEVHSIQIILPAFQGLLEDLGTSPPRRKALIQVDELISTLTDGVLIFSDLEAFVVRGSSSPTLSGQFFFAWRQKDVYLLVARMQCFKSSINVMLNILQCESDLEAKNSQRELLSIISNVLRRHLELSRRIAHLSDCFATSYSFLTSRPASLLGAESSLEATATSRLQETNKTLFMAPFGATHNLEFESELEASRVYRKAKRESVDFSFCSSMVLSNAWSALSDISLSDISIISVIALPIAPRDIFNMQHYKFEGKPLPLPECIASTTSDWELDNFTSAASDDTVPRLLMSSAAASEADKRLTGPGTTTLEIVAWSSNDVDVASLVEKFGSVTVPFQANPKLPIAHTRLDKVHCAQVRLNIRDPEEWESRKRPEAVGTHGYINTIMLILVYDIASRESFRAVQNLAPPKVEYPYPSIIWPTANLRNLRERFLQPKVKLSLVNTTICFTRSLRDLRSIQNAFSDLVRYTWFLDEIHW